MFTIKLSTFMNRLLLLLALLPVSMAVNAQDAAATNAAPQSVWSNPLALAMLAIIIVLLLVIVLLANVVLGTAEWYFKKDTGAAKTVALLIALSLPALTQAQDATTTAAPANIGGLTATTFFLLLAVIGVELIVILVMAMFVRSFLAKEKAKAAVAEAAGTTAEGVNWQKLWDKFNSFRPITEESKIDLGHNYDGIRELNNRLPGWWLYGFYGTILFGALYLWRYHVSHSAPSSAEELKIALIKGEEQTKAFLAKAANNVDENTVTFIKDAAALQSAEGIFKATCKTCHGEKGEGNQIGPNLTDEFWIHGGGIKDIFKTIKYGFPEKGMQSWKDQYTPIQMAQLASYIKSLQGTNPPNAKAPQGELYKEAPAADSSTMPKQDTTLKTAVSKN